MPTQTLTRAALVRRGAGGGLALAVATTPLALLPSVAAAAPPDGDLAYLRLLLAAELLAVDFSRQALHELPPRPAQAYRRILLDEKQHAAQLGKLLTAAGQTALTAA